MATRTAPLRAKAPQRSLDEHPLDVIEPVAPVEPVAAPRARPPGRGATPAPAVVRGSLQGLDWRQALGGTLVVLGMLGIIVAWFGVSGTLDPGEQMPFISSGGFGGSALIAIGVTLLVSFEHSRDRDALAQVLDELDELRQRLDRDADAAGLSAPSTR